MLTILSKLPGVNEDGSSDLIVHLIRRRRRHELLDFVRSYIPSAVLKEDTLREYQLVIGLHERSNPSYWSMFKALDEETNQRRLRVSSYGIHDVSLEEIFIKAVQLKATTNAEITDDAGSGCGNDVMASSASASSSPTTSRRRSSEQLDTAAIVEEDSSESEENENESSLTSMQFKNKPLIANKTQCPVKYECKHDIQSCFKLDSTDSQTSSTSSSSSKLSLYNLDYIYIDLEKGSSLLLKQCMAIVVKRYLYNKRNWKSLMTQIILPALFICIAMTVALSAPGFLDLPPLELSTAQFYPLPMTKPDGIYVPFSYIPNLTTAPTKTTSTTSPTDDPISKMSASSSDIVNTLHLLVGIGSTCVLNQANLTLLDLLNINNMTGYVHFNQRYFGSSDWCRVVFNDNCDIDYEYFPIGESKMAENILKNVKSSESIIDI